MTTQLTQMKCEACSGSTPKLTSEQVRELSADINSEWTVVGDNLHREWKSSDFNSAFSRATAIALLAEQEGHHPDLQIGWGRLVCDLTTHAINGLSWNDFIMAAKIDRL